MSSSILGGNLDDLIDALQHLTEEQWKQIMPNVGILSKGLRSHYKKINSIRDENIEYAVEAKKILNEFGEFNKQSSKQQKKTLKNISDYLTKAHDAASVEYFQLEQLMRGFEERAGFLKDQIKISQEKFDNATTLDDKKKFDEEIKLYTAKLDDNQLAINEYNKALKEKTKELQSIKDEMTVNGVGSNKLRDGATIVKESGGVSNATNGGNGGGQDLASQIAGTINQVVSAGADIAALQMQKTTKKMQAATDIQTNQLETGQKIFARELNLVQKGMQTAISAAFVGITTGIQDGSYSVAQETFDNVTEMSKARYDTELDRLKSANYEIMTNLQLQADLQKLTNQQINAGMGAIDGIVGIFGGATAKLISGVAKGLVSATTKLMEAKTEQEVAIAKMKIDIEEKKLQALNELKKTILDDAKETSKKMLDLTKAIETRYKQIDAAGHSVGAELGMQQNTQMYTDFMRKALRDMSFEANGKKYYLDNSPEDVAKMQKEYANSSGYNQVMNKEDLVKMSQMGIILGDNNLAATLIGSMDVFNKSVSGASDLLTEMYIKANKAGVSNKKFAQDLANNLKIAEKHTFKGGVKAMMEMALWAQKTKFSMQTLDSLVDGIQKGGLEGLITQGAKLQVLGGHFAMGADPLAMMYEGWNDPESLGKRFVDMTKGIGKFDKKTGEVDISGGDAMLLRAFADAQGIGYDEARQIVIKRVKSQEIDKHISKNYTDEQKELIYNKAKLNQQTGKWEVTTNDGRVKDINSLGEGDWASIMPIEQSTNNYVAEILSIMKREKGIEEHNQNMLADETSENMKKNIEERMQMNLKWVDENIALWKEMVEKTNNQVTELNEANQQKLLASKDAISQQMDLMIEEVKIFTKGITDVNGKYMLALESAILDTKAELLRITKGENDEEYKKASEAAADKTNELASSIQTAVQETSESEMLKNVIKDYNTNDYKAYQTLSYVRDTKKFNATGANEILNDWGHSLEDSFRTLSKEQLKKLGFKDGTVSNRLIADRLLNDQDFFNMVKHAIGMYEKEGNVLKGNEKQQQFTDTKDYKLSTSTQKKDVKDGIMSGNGSSMQVAASEVIPVNDGAAKIASSHPNDTAIFAKTGGPFDTLFNGVFARVDDIYEGFVAPKSDKKLSDAMRVVENTTNNKSSRVEFGELRISGSLELKSGGKSFDIMSMIKDNPQFIRDFSEMLSSQLTIANSGGRGNMSRSESKLFS